MSDFVFIFCFYSFLPRINLVNFRTQNLTAWVSEPVIKRVSAVFYVMLTMLTIQYDIHFFCILISLHFCEIEFIIFLLLINKHAEFLKTCYHKWTLKINQNHVVFKYFHSQFEFIHTICKAFALENFTTTFFILLHFDWKLKIMQN